MAEVFEHGASLTNYAASVVDDSDTTASTALIVPSCEIPNVTQANTIQKSPDDITNELVEVQGLILDDPATLTEDDFWLHPCQCVPSAWGNHPPVSPDAYDEIPFGSRNVFQAPKLIKNQERKQRVVPMVVPFSKADCTTKLAMLAWHAGTSLPDCCRGVCL